MHQLAERRARDEIPDTLVLLEHPPTYTAGRTADRSHLLWDEARIAARGASIYDVDRGGSFTFHGPGQLVGYPIVKLQSRLEIIPHLRRMEEVIIRAGRDLGVLLVRDERRTGVWANEAKVCALGVRLTAARVTMHGFGLNCTTDLSWFDAIVACGIADRTVTTLSALASRPVSVPNARELVLRRYAEVFNATCSEASPELIDLFPAMTAPATIAQAR